MNRVGEEVWGREGFRVMVRGEKFGGGKFGGVGKLGTGTNRGVNVRG